MANLVIIESPYKAPTIKNYLGSNYKVVASKGHLRDLPKSSLGVDIENGFEAHYINIRGKGETIKELKKEAKNASKIYFATDPDREGEAISWHLANVLGIPIEKTKRITFNELTKSAIKESIKNPRNIDEELVNSQQARRILDRIVGYKLSPFLWKTVRSGLSAGRVQSVATRIIVEREREINSFVPKEYYTIEANLCNKDGVMFTAHFFGANREKIELDSKELTEKIVNGISGKGFSVASVKKSLRLRNPAPPFITSTLQQEASKRLGFQSQRIMRVAQELYEGINLGASNGGVQGLITYMRTDSLRISKEAADNAKKYICERYGDKYYPSSPRVYKSKSNAQDAHEAIRPTDLKNDPESIKKMLTSDQYRLYKLIWNRFLSSQMSSAEFDTVSAVLESGGYEFRAAGSTLKFNGFMAVCDSVDDDEEFGKKEKLPEISEKEMLSCSKIVSQQHFTEPPMRYNEGTLVKFLEEKGIGRPSTFATIITTILSRGYVERDGKSLKPTPLGELTTDIMKKYFSDIVDYAFTAQMESELDGISNGSSNMQAVLSNFYGNFEKHLENAEKNVTKEEIILAEKEANIICDKCGSRMVIKQGRFGEFAACPNFPECRNTKPIDKEGNAVIKEQVSPKKAEGVCEACGGDLVIRNGKFGDFVACANYPKCKYTKQILKPIGIACPKCNSQIVAVNGKRKNVFYSCEKHPECDFVSWDLPTKELCPECGNMLYVKKGKNLLVCHEKDCGYKREIAETENEST